MQRIGTNVIGFGETRAIRWGPQIAWIVEEIDDTMEFWAFLNDHWTPLGQLDELQREDDLPYGEQVLELISAL